MIQMAMIGVKTIMTSEENLGSQFDDIIGRNVSKNEQKEMHAKAIALNLMDGIAAIFGGPKSDASEDELVTHRNYTFMNRATHFPNSMIKSDENSQFHVSHTEPDGWKHTWYGGPYIEHHHPKHGLVDATSIDSKNIGGYGDAPYEKGLFTPHEFLQHIDDFNAFKNDYN